MEDRVKHCQSKGCSYPLAWSVSPHLLYLAPDWLEWYYSKANQTGQDVFVLPPSGHLYSYPGMMPDKMQSMFVKRTADDCQLLWATSSVHWEWFFGWESAFKTYFPRYLDGTSCVKSFFATDVPYNFENVPFYPDPIEWPKGGKHN